MKYLPIKEADTTIVAQIAKLIKRIHGSPLIPFTVTSLVDMFICGTDIFVAQKEDGSIIGVGMVSHTNLLSIKEARIHNVVENGSDPLIVHGLIRTMIETIQRDSPDHQIKFDVEPDNEGLKTFLLTLGFRPHKVSYRIKIEKKKKIKGS